MSNTHKPEDYAFSAKEIFLAISIGCGIAFFLGGAAWAIGVFIVLLILAIINKAKTSAGTPANTAPQQGTYRPSTTSKTPRQPARPRIIDEIQFSYIPAHGEQNTYTVKVAKGIRGNIEGYCDERDDIRTFRIDRIVNSEITRVSTGEVLTVKEWRALFRGKMS